MRVGKKLILLCGLITVSLLSFSKVEASDGEKVDTVATSSDAEKKDDGEDTEGNDEGETGNEEVEEIITGWIKQSDATWIYHDDKGENVTGWKIIDDYWYFFNEKGIMAVGWNKVKDNWYYHYPSGRMATGWIESRDHFFYLSESGKMQTGWQKINNNWYYFRAGGTMVTGWQKVNNEWFYLDSNGRMQTGWKYIGKNWYHFRTSGIMDREWEKIGADWYYFYPSGKMVSGWLKLGNDWYSFYQSGRMMHDTWCGDYYLQSNGMMAKNMWIGNYHVDKNGRKDNTWEKYNADNMHNKAKGYDSDTSYLILVNRSTHRVGIYKKANGSWTNIKYLECSDGSDKTPTIEGTFTTKAKGVYFDHDNARLWYYTQFCGDYLFHSVLYAQEPSPDTIIDGRLGKPLSLGCVRLSLSEAKWIYDNIPYGTKVVVYH